jgi:hypothetical protein
MSLKMEVLPYRVDERVADLCVNVSKRYCCGEREEARGEIGSPKASNLSAQPQA